MTTAERLTAVAENVKKVYEAGKAAGGGEVSFVFGDGQVLLLDAVASIAANGKQAQKMLLGKNILWEHAFDTYYQRVTYLESNGSQCIDTEYRPLTDKIKIVAKYCYVSAQAGQSLFGSEKTGTGGGYSIVPYKTASAVALYIANTTNLLATTVSSNNDIEMIVEAQNGSLSLTINGYTANASYAGSFYSGDSIGLFASKRDGVPGQFSYARIYEFSIYDNGEQVRKFVPCYRRSDNVAGMYDLINNTFHTNIGGGTFAVGPDDSEASETDYIDALATLGVE